MFVFDLRDIFRKNSGVKLRPVHQTKNRFFVKHQNNFTVSKDGNLVIGPSFEDDHCLIIEDLSNRDYHKIDFLDVHDGQVSTVLLDEKSNTLLAGDIDGQLTEYALIVSNTFCKKKKEFGDIDVGPVLSCCQFGSLAFFGGWYRVRVIDLKTGEDLGSFGTALGYIYSIEVVEISESQTVLFVFGEEKYEDDKSDMFDISELVQKYSFKDLD